MSHAGQTAHCLVNISIALPLKSNTPYLKWTCTMWNYVHLLTDPRTTGISHFKEKGLSHSNQHWDTFIDSCLNTSLKNHYNSAQLIFFRELNSKWIMQRRKYLNCIQINLYYLNVHGIPRSLCQICPPDIKLVPKAYGVWLIALIYCVKVSINWSCHFVVNITKKEILNGCVRSSIWPLKSVNLSHV